MAVISCLLLIFLSVYLLVAMPESDSSEGPTPAKKSRRLLTVEKKLEIVAYAKSVSINVQATSSRLAEITSETGRTMKRS